MLRDKAGRGGSGRGTKKVSGSGKGGNGGGKAGSGSGKGGSVTDKGRRGVTECFDISATMSPMSPTTRSCASNAVATSALHGGGKGGSGSGKGGSSGGTGGSGSGKGRRGGTDLFDASGATILPTSPTTRSCASNAVATCALHGGGKGGSGSGEGRSGSSKGKSGGGTEFFATSAAMSSTPPPQPGKLLLLPQELTTSRAVLAVLLVEARIVTRMIGSGRVAEGDWKLPADDG
jgi:hypothetical protein